LSITALLAVFFISNAKASTFSNVKPSISKKPTVLSKNHTVLSKNCQIEGSQFFLGVNNFKFAQIF